MLSANISWSWTFLSMLWSGLFVVVTTSKTPNVIGTCYWKVRNRPNGGTLQYARDGTLRYHQVYFGETYICNGLLHISKTRYICRKLYLQHVIINYIFTFPIASCYVWEGLWISCDPKKLMPWRGPVPSLWLYPQVSSLPRVAHAFQWCSCSIYSPGLLHPSHSDYKQETRSVSLVYPPYNLLHRSWQRSW